MSKSIGHQSSNSLATHCAGCSPEIVEIRRVKTKTHEASPRRHTLKNINTREKLKNVKKEDPFLYYSIPELKHSKICETMTSSDTTTGGEGPSNETEVTRKTRITFEYYPDLSLLDLLKEDDTNYCEGDNSEDYLDLVMSLNWQ